MKNVLFVCTHNAGRSQMAQALFERHGPDDIRAESAGQEPAGRVWPEVVEAMREIGIDLSERRPKKLTVEMQRHADWAITLACGAQCPYVPTTVEDWDIPDPAGKPLEQVRAIRDAVEVRVRDLIERLAAIRSERPRRIYNPVQRDTATFLKTSEETGGERTLVELEIAPNGKVTPHYHPTYSERFTVLEGRLIVEVDGVRHELGTGDEATAAPGSLHAWSNPDEQRSVARVELRPGSPGFEKGLRVAYGLAADGLVLKNGVPRSPLHTALLLEMGGLRLPGPYAPPQRILVLLARLARWRGLDRKLESRYL